MAGQKDVVTVLVAAGLTVVALCSIPLIINAGGSVYRWSTLAGSTVLAVVLWSLHARRAR
jgi:hypothetical protein